MLKRSLIVAVFVLAAASCPALAGDAQAAGHADLAVSGHGITRGIVNFFTGWLEIPRCVVYDSGYFHPSYGWFIGLIEGSFMTVGRTTVGFADAFTFGFAGDAVHSSGSLPDYIWEAKWVYRAGNE